MTDAYEALVTVRKGLLPTPQEAEALEVLKRFIDDALEKPPVVDTEAIAIALASGEWTARWDGEMLDMHSSLIIEGALAWECTSCRPDIGWAKTPVVIRKGDEVVINVECGHCGNQYAYDREGNDLG